MQLLNLIETSSGKKQEQFLGLISQESPAWEQELKKKMLTVERVFTWPSDVMSEVLTRLQPLTLCVSLWGRPAEQIEKILAPLPPISKKKLLDQIAELKPNSAERATCEMKLIAEVRAIAASGYIKFEKFDAELFVEENIEERLSNSESGLAYLNKIDVHFSEPSGEPKDGGSQATSGSNHSQELDMAKRKLNHLMHENNALKSENQALKDKLAQIKRIA